MMDATVSGGLLSIPVQASRKEWRVVGDGSPSRFSEDSSRLHGTGTGRPRAANARLSPPQIFQSRSTDQDPTEDSATYKEKTHKRDEQLDSSGRLVLPDSPEDGLQLHEIVRQREQLQNMELEIRAQFIARSEILRIQSGFEEQSKKNASIVANLQEQVQEREMRIHDLKQQLDEKEHQLQANRMEASEAVSQVWAKDGLLLEQKNELASSRRERDNAVAEQKAAVAQFEVERAQLLTQVQDLKDQAHEKELQMQGIAEQHHTAQDLLKYKDGQLREAQAWMQRAQERDAFLANTNNSLHAELRDRTDQINQLWLSYQRQLAELERYHAQTVQRLQVEITEMREQNLLLKGEPKHEGIPSVGCSDESAQASETISKLSPAGVLQNNHSKNNNTILQREAVSKAEHAIGAPLTRAQVVGVAPAALSSAPVTTIMQHSFGAQPGLPPILQVNQPALAQFLQPIPTAVPTQQGQSPIIQHQLPQTQRCVQRQVQHHAKNQSNISPPSKSNECNESPLQHDLDRLSAHQGSGEGEQGSRLSENVDSSGLPSKVQQLLHHLQQQQQNNQFPLQKSGSHISWSHQDQWQYQMPSGDLPDKEELEQQLQELSVHPNEVFKKEAHSNQQQEVESQIEGELSNGLASLGTTPLDNRDSLVSFQHENEANKEKSQDSEFHSSIMPVNQQQPVSANGNKVVELRLLDEKSLLACLVRAIPSEPSAKIRISTTLPNRLGKMLAPLHWHDYKRRYGRLHDFVGSHPELFVIEGDFIHLREGAHAIVSATTAVAKVAAAAAASVAESTWLPTVAVTPVAQSQVQRLKILKAVNASQCDPEQGNTVQKPFHSSSDERASSSSSSSQGQNNKSSRGIQGQEPLIKNVVENKKIGNSHTVGISVNATVQHDEQPVMKILGAQSQVIMSTANDSDIEKTSANVYGNVRVLNGRNANYFVNGQMGRNLSLVSGAFVKQQMNTWVETQGNPVSRSTSAH